ncbi:bifunctional metallophosphatase/5'-nucleotidase [Oenococcus sicerae]|uniref:Bifunctional metallophosphatase/5'-nucleotidase n=1 Tax=Oenococcus sicerae TaxID=2203724 RepID=A0AAJ1RAP6_9LACO|nr:bifunctional UDP-sugar hydrolase/5'-nucleotidase [Oenococcus sicerae]MDN6900118.1 bifunctional metallophosphatase/5'-nucleotidase [Oenococcus sicerae]
MKIYLLSTSDVHGYIAPSNFVDQQSTSFGLARAKTLIDQFRADHADDIVLTIENGDFIQGSPLTNYIAQKRTDYVGLYEKLAKIVGYDARVLGNHEFNYGKEYTQSAIPKNAGVLDANVFDRKAHFYADPYKIFDFGAVKIGILGLTTEYIPHWESASHLMGLTFENPVQTAEKYVPIMKKAGADVIVVAYHAGFECDLDTGQATEKITGENRGYELLQKVSGIDALITGHQHRELAQLVKTPFGSIPITQPGYQAAAVGAIRLDFDPDSKNIIHRNAKLLLTAKFPADSRIMESLSIVQPELDRFLDEKIGEIDPDMLIHDHFNARLHGHPYLSLVNKVQAEAVNADISANALFSNAVLGLPHETTRRDIATNYLFPNTAVAEEITGQDLLNALERAAEYFVLNKDGSISVSDRFGKPIIKHYNYDYFSGIDYTFDLRQPIGSRVKDVSYHGQAIKKDQIYRIALSNYRSSGVGGYSSYSVTKIVQSSTVDMVDLLTTYVSNNSPIQSFLPNNLTIITK